ncbi:MAG: cohesin domain-containing protein [Patescibacteria group bacterium]
MRKILIFSSVLIICLTPFSGLKAQESASIFLSPSSGTFQIGSTFNISIFVDTGGRDINAIRVDLKFDPKKLQVASPTTGQSFISVWIAQPSYSNIEGTVSFQGGVPGTGIRTSSGLVSTITFRAITPGSTTISVRDTSQVLLSDGKGTDILGSMGKGIYEIVLPPPEGPAVISSTHPDQNRWYKNNNLTFSWEKEVGVTDFSYMIDNDFQGVPDNISEGSDKSVSHENLKDGIWYFHIKAKKGNSWGGITHYVVKIDSTPPAEFRVGIEPGLASIISVGQPIISFMTTDALSGLDHYEVKMISYRGDIKESTEFFVEAASPYRAPLEAGVYKVIVRAFDKAGNWRDALNQVRVVPVGKFIVVREGINFWIIFLRWWQLILLICLIGLIIFFIKFWPRVRKKYRQQKII